MALFRRIYLKTFSARTTRIHVYIYTQVYMYMNIINGHTTDDTYIARGRIMLGVMTTIHCASRTVAVVVGRG